MTSCLAGIFTYAIWNRLRFSVCPCIHSSSMKWGVMLFYKKKPKKTLSLYLINSASRPEDIWGSGDIDPPVNLGTRWRWMINSAPRPRYPGGGGAAPGRHWIQGCLGPRAGLDVVKWETSCPCQKSNPESSMAQTAPHRDTELSRLLLNRI
jgi:hypothetical protein